jgi:S-DNA-T family DNA segregation ATPase FtsK/SpoIIIE
VRHYGPNAGPDLTGERPDTRLIMSKRPKIIQPRSKLPMAGDIAFKCRHDEYWGLLLITAAVFLFLCLISYDPRDPSFNVATSRSNPSNLCGLVGSHVADWFAQLMGVASLLVPASLAVLALHWLLGRPRVHPWIDAAGMALLISAACCLLERCGFNWARNFAGVNPGGALGAFLHSFCLKFVGGAGEMVLGLSLILVCSLQVSGISPGAAARFALRAAAWSAKLLGRLGTLRRRLYIRPADASDHSVRAGCVSEPSHL